MEKISNDEKVKRLNKRRILLYLIVVFGVLTIALAIASLVDKINPVFSILCFLIEAFLTKYRNGIDPELNTK